MAAPIPKDKVNDREYSNWLKVTLALYYMKSGLHTFIQSEIECLHQSLVQKIYGGKTVPLPHCTICHACHVQRNKYGGVWTFQKQCKSYCDVWLYELLALHTNPKSENIYWGNSDVASWPFKPWECAKVFMPRGQLPSNDGPDECDAQALLALLTNCKHFHPKLSQQGLGLTSTISTIRNRVMHDGAMKLSDADRETYIQQIIKFLEDAQSLKSLEDCKVAVGSIQKIENDSIDVFFNVGLQMIALQEAVNAVRKDLGMEAKRTSDSVESLKEEYRQIAKQLRIKLEAVEDRVGTVENTIDTVENRVGTVENTIDTIKNRVGTVENRQDTFERDLQSVREQNETAQQQQVELSQALSESVATLGVRVENVEENLQEIGQRTDQHEKFIQEIKASTSQGTDQVSAEKMESGINKLRDDLIKAYRNLRCVQVSPIFEKRRRDIDDIYVDLVIEEKQGCRNTKGGSKDVYTQCKDAQTHPKEPIKVTSYKQLFLDERGLMFKRVYLCGKGGLGKTTFCRKVLHAWCNAHENRATTQDGVFQDEAVLRTFDLLFYMNLREVSLEENLIEVICTQFPLEEIPNKNVLGTLLKDHGNKLLFILDGLDEMIVKPKFLENVVTRRVYPNCCFLVSSRPWKISQMELQEGTEIDLLLDLKGFSEENARKCAKKIFKICYKDGNVIDNFMEDIEGNKLAMQLIHVPLLLLFLAQVWYENKRSLPSKFHELYILFLNLLTDRVKEKYRKDPNHRQMRFTLSDMQSPLPSKISETSLVVNFGEGLLLSLCEVAHHFLLRSQKENSLVFEETKLLNALGDGGKEKLSIALDLGILSVTDSLSYLNRKTNVSFLHKTMQEFFTSLCFVLRRDKLANFISSISDLNAVQQNENIIVFLVGLMPEIGNRVLEKVNELSKDQWDMLGNTEKQGCMPKDDNSVLEDMNKFQLCMPQDDDSVLEDINEVFKLCMPMVDDSVLEEMDEFQLCIKELLLLCIPKNYDSINFENINKLFQLFLPDDNNFVFKDMNESFQICMPNYYNGVLEKVKRLCQSCMSEDEKVPEDIIQFLQVCFPKNYDSALDKVIKLCMLYMPKGVNSALGKVNELWKGHRRTEEGLELYRYELSDISQIYLRCKDEVIGENMLLNVLGLTLQPNDFDLHSLNPAFLQYLELTGDQHTWESDFILVNLRKLGGLKYLRLRYLSYALYLPQPSSLSVLIMITVTLSPGCCGKLGSTLTHCTEMKKLKLYNTDLHSCVLDLTNMAKLKVLDMSEITLSSSCCDVLGSTLTHCIDMKTLHIHSTDLHNCMLSLSSMTELTDLVMSRVTLSKKCCDVLGRTLTCCMKLERIVLHKTNLFDCHFDFSHMTGLRAQSMSEVTLSSSCCDLIGSTLKHCSKLKELKIHKTELHSCHLDLSNITELRVLDMSEVILSNSCCDVLCSTLTQCTNLHSLQILFTNLHNCLLDISNMTKLTDLVIKGVTLCGGYSDALCSTLTHFMKLTGLPVHKINLFKRLLDQSDVKTLIMSGVKLSSKCCDVLDSTLTHCSKPLILIEDKTNLHRCLIDLSKLTELKVLVMVGVTLSSTCCDVFGITLKHCTKLQVLEIQSIDLHNSLLDLTNMTDLRALSMAGVTLSCSSCDVLGRTLTHCTKLEKVKIHKTNLCNCLLDFSNMTELRTLEVSEVTLSISCCDVLGSTLTHCTKLQHLVIHNVHLHNCLLGLSNMTELRALDVSNVTLSSSCCDVLGSTLTNCTKLEKLVIQKTNIHSCLLDLSKMTELRILNMSEAKVSSNCCDVLGNTLTNCTKLEYLGIQSIDLHNCLLDLSNMTELRVLCMLEVTLSSSCCDILGSTVTHCTKLEEVKIKTTNLHSCVLDLSNMIELTEICMSEVTLSSSCCDVLGSSLAHCTKLEMVLIHKTNLHNCLLNLSNVIELKTLIMSEVILSNSCCDVLGSTLAHCTKLQHLEIQSIDLHNCLLDLSNMTELRALDVSNVMLSSSCCDVLGSTLTHCTKLEKLVIQKTNIHSCLLNLSKMTELRILNMSEAKVSSKCCDVLGNTLTHCTKLQKLEMRSTHLHNCLLDLSNMTELIDLVMDGVEMFSSSPYVLFHTQVHSLKQTRLSVHKQTLPNSLVDHSNTRVLKVLFMSGVTLSSQSPCDVIGSTMIPCTSKMIIKIQKTNLHSCVLDLSNMTKLTDLIMDGVTLFNSPDVLGSILAHCTKLGRLVLYSTDLQNCMLDLSNMTELTEICMSEVTLSSNCCDVLGRTLTHCTMLQQLYIHSTDLHNCLLNLSNMTELRALDVSNVMLSNNCCYVLCSTLTHCTKLQHLEIRSIDLHNYLLDLSNMTELRALDVSNVMLSNSCCYILGITLIHCTKLQHLEIQSIDLHNCLLDLSNMTELRTLDVSNVLLSNSCCDALGSTLTHCTKLEKLVIQKTNIHSCLLDLSKMTELRILNMSEAKVSSNCCDVLGNTLTNCTKLQQLYIHSTDLHNCLLDLSNMTELRALDVSNVMLSSSCCDVLGSTLTHCTKLEKLVIQKTNIHSCLLDLSKMTELKILNMSEAKVSSNCCDVLGNTLTNCTKLEYLGIQSIDLHNCLLDLSNMTELRVLCMLEVTLSSSCCDILGSTVTHCTKLEEVKIKTTNLHSCVLDLSNMIELTEICMSEVTLSSSCCDVLGSSLAHCTKLEMVLIHKTNLHNCLLNLSNVIELKTLIMSEVILSNSCCDVLGSTLAHCTKLQHLEIQSIDLHNCLLDLSNMTELRALDVSNVMLSSSCCDVLGSTLTHCTKLEKLVIQKTNIHSCLLNLSKMTELRILNMSEAKVSSKCCDVLGNTLTHCTKLQKLEMRSTHLHNCLLDLSNMTELIDLVMDGVEMFSSSPYVLFHTQVHSLKQTRLSVHKQTLPNSLVDHSNTRVLKVLFMSGVTLSSQSPCDVIGSTMIPCTSKMIIKIQKTNLHSCVLDLSNMTKLTDLIMDGVTLFNSPDVLGSILAHCTKLGRLVLYSTDLQNCMLDLSNMTELTEICMSEVTLSSNCCDVLGRTLTHCTMLQQLYIHSTDLHNCLLNLSNMTELRALDVSDVMLSSSCCDVLGSTLTHCTKLGKLVIQKTNIHSCLLDLSKMTELRILNMSEAKVSSNCCDVLGNTLTNCTKLQQLYIHSTDLHNCLLDLSNMTELAVLDISAVTLSSSCCDVLGNTLTHCTKLKSLVLQLTDLHNCLLDLSNMRMLIFLSMNEITMSSSCDMLGNTLTHCTRLKTLHIKATDLHSCELDLSNMIELTELVMSKVSLSNSCCDVFGSSLTCCTKLKMLHIDSTDLHNCVLDLSNMTDLTVLDISAATLSSSCCNVFSRTLTHCTKLKKVMIKKKNLHSCLLDLSNIIELTEICMSEVTLSSSCCDVLGSSLAHCTKLEMVLIHKTNLHNCLLNLSNMIELKTLIMSEVILSNSCCDVLGSTLAHCTKLQHLEIQSIDLHNCLLDLSNLTELRALDVSNVMLSSSCCDVLGSTLTHCTELRTLHIKDTDLHNGILNLSGLTELTDLAVSRVTMSNSCCDVLGSTLTHCIKLKSLVLHLTDLHNCLLDLSNMTELTDLVISELTLSSSCCDLLASTLTWCTKLERLKIHKTHLHNGMLHLSKMTELTGVILKKVTLSISCCDVLGNTLKHCTKLKTLSICNIDFHNCMLDFSNMTELTSLHMCKVTLCSGCCDELGHTMVHCNKLDRLSMHYTDLHNCVLDLSSMTHLTVLNISGVTLSGRCCDVLGSSLKHCTTLEKLKIHKTNLHNCLLDFSNMTELQVLDISEVTLSSNCSDVFGSTLLHCRKLKILNLQYTELHNCVLDFSNWTELRLILISGLILSSISACQAFELSLNDFAIKNDMTKYAFETTPHDNGKFEVNMVDEYEQSLPDLGLQSDSDSASDIDL